MKLATFTHLGSTRVGIVEGEEVVDLAEAAPDVPRGMTALLAAGPAALETVARAAGGKGRRLPLDDVRLEAPVARPPKILAIGLKYAEHARESGQEPPEIPIVFHTQATAVTGP